MLRRTAVCWLSTRPLRYATILALDALATVCALWGALFLRLHAVRVPSEYVVAAVVAAQVLVCVRILVALLARVHCWSFRMSGFSEAVRLGIAMAAGSAIFLVALLSFTPYRLPRTVYALEFFFATSFMGGYRFAPRLALSWRSEQQ